MAYEKYYLVASDCTEEATMPTENENKQPSEQTINEEEVVKSISKFEFEDLIQELKKSFPPDDRIDPEVIYTANSFEELKISEKEIIELLLSYHNYTERMEDLIERFTTKQLILQSLDIEELQEDILKTDGRTLKEVLRDKQYPNRNNIISALRYVSNKSIRLRLLLEEFRAEGVIDKRTIINKKKIEGIRSYNAMLSDSPFTKNKLDSSTKTEPVIEDDF